MGGLAYDIKLQPPSSMRIHLVINMSQIVRYKEQVKGQKKEKGKPVEIERVEELQQKEAIWTLKYEVKWIADGTTTEGLADGTV